MVVTHRGIESRTPWLKVMCSTGWANGSFLRAWIYYHNGIFLSRQFFLQLIKRDLRVNRNYFHCKRARLVIILTCIIMYIKERSVFQMSTRVPARVPTEEELSKLNASIENVRKTIDADKSNGKRRNCCVVTYGCQQNEADSEQVAGMAVEMGYKQF